MAQWMARIKRYELAAKDEYIQHNTKIPKNEFLSAITFVLSSTYFTFNSIIYRQTHGTSMSSPLSPVIADAVMQGLETACLNRINC